MSIVLSAVRVCVLLLFFCAPAAPSSGAAPAEESPLQTPLCDERLLFTWGGIGDQTVTHSRAGSAMGKARTAEFSSSSIRLRAGLGFFDGKRSVGGRPFTEIFSQSVAVSSLCLKPCRAFVGPSFGGNDSGAHPARVHCAWCVGSLAEKSGNEEKNVEKNIVSYYFLSDFPFTVRAGASCHAPWVNPLR